MSSQRDNEETGWNTAGGRCEDDERLKRRLKSGRTRITQTVAWMGVLWTGASILVTTLVDADSNLAAASVKHRYLGTTLDALGGACAIAVMFPGKRLGCVLLNVIRVLLAIWLMVSGLLEKEGIGLTVACGHVVVGVYTFTVLAQDNVRQGRWGQNSGDILTAIHTFIWSTALMTIGTVVGGYRGRPLISVLMAAVILFLLFAYPIDPITEQAHLTTLLGLIRADGPWTMWDVGGVTFTHSLTIKGISGLVIGSALGWALIGVPFTGWPCPGDDDCQWGSFALLSAVGAVALLCILWFVLSALKPIARYAMVAIQSIITQHH